MNSKSKIDKLIYLSKLKPEKDFITNLKKKKSGLFYFYL